MSPCSEGLWLARNSVATCVSSQYIAPSVASEKNAVQLQNTLAKAPSVGPKFWVVYSMHWIATVARPNATAPAANLAQPARRAFMPRPAITARTMLATRQTMNAIPRPLLGFTCFGRHT